MMPFPAIRVQHAEDEPFFAESCETLGDTTPGAFDPLGPLEEHPAITAAREATALPVWWPFAAVALLVVSIALGFVFPWGWAPAP